MHIDIQPFAEYAVAPYVGAWIETPQWMGADYLTQVAPYVGAWIETFNQGTFSFDTRVAPYVGAWIETTGVGAYLDVIGSHPTWVRGLKHSIGATKGRKLASHPTWVRGLKLPERRIWNKEGLSHPTWVRGLKHLHRTSNHPRVSRTLRGCVD